MRCKNCYNYYFEEDADGVRYHFCDIFDCQLCEIAGVDRMKGCELYDQKDDVVRKNVRDRPRGNGNAI